MPASHPRSALAAASRAIPFVIWHSDQPFDRGQLIAA
jgi:hypothetical protein